MSQVTWRGLTADYDEDEREHMAQLRRAGDVDLAALVHETKALLDARIVPATPDPPAFAPAGWTDRSVPADEPRVYAARRSHRGPVEGQASLL